MWSLAIWDNVERHFFLSRDRVGKKPLFYCRIHNEFVFASEMKAIFPFLGNVEINHGILHDAMKNNFSYEVTENCLVKNIFRFPAGSYGIYKDGSLEIKKSGIPSKKKFASRGNYDEQVEMFRELFMDSCKIRMRSDVTIGTALSGGIDSSAIICAMNSIAKTMQ